MINRELIHTGLINDANLVSYWRMEGNSNDSKGANNGTDTSITYGTNYGKFGQGADFSNSRITFGLNFNFTTQDFSFSMWIKIDTWVSSDEPTQGGVFLFKGAWGEAGYYAQILRDSGGIVFVTCQSGTAQASSTTTSFTTNTWHHLAITRKGSSVRLYHNGVDVTSAGTHINPTSSPDNFELGSFRDWARFNGQLDDVAVFSRTLSSSEIYNLYNGDKTKLTWGENAGAGRLPCADDSTIGLNTWPQFKVLLDRSVEAGKLSTQDVVSTYSLVHTRGTGYAYSSAVVASNGDVHFIPLRAYVGQKISVSGIISTYSLIYTGEYLYASGVLAPNGDIHFIPLDASVGQKVSASGVVSTYSLVYTATTSYHGGILAPNGDIHFVPRRATRGQKISSSGVVSTYSLVYTNTDAYVGGVIAPNGDIHFVPLAATVGQKISTAGVVSTYSLVYTNGLGAYLGGSINSNGDIHFAPYLATIGQKISAVSTISTYSLVYTTSYGYVGAILAPNGDIHFIPHAAAVGQKVSASGVVSTYSLVYTNSVGYFASGVLDKNGDIHFGTGGPVGQKISTQSALPFSLGTCCSPYFNKF